MQPPPPTITSNSPVNGIARKIFSHESSIMVAAIIFLILVIIFVLLLHVYAKWFLVRARRRSARRSVAVPRVLRPRPHQFHSFTVDALFADDIATKGLDSSEISSIPLFVYKVDEEHKNGRLECAICLSFFEEEELGRKLTLCGHAFHVICIDTWLHSHSSCPICRHDLVTHFGNIHDLNPRATDHQGSNNHEGMLIEVHSACPICRRDSVTRTDYFHDLNPRPNDYENLNDESMLNEVTLESLATSDQVDTIIRSDKDTILAIIVDNEVASPQHENVCTRESASPSVPSGSLFVTESVKKMISRSRSERKVHPSMDLQEKLDAQVKQ